MKQLKLLFLLLIVSSLTFAQSEGELTVSVKTSDTGGKFSPRNVVAIWIENTSGEFVKTLLAYGDKRKGYLTHWKNSTTAAGSAYNKTDAISGATQSSHTTRKCNWDGTNFKGDRVNDDNYKLCMELTDKNSTGNYSTFDIVKSAEVTSLSPTNVPSYSNIQIQWTPSKTSAVLIQDNDEFKVYPSPNSGLLKIDGNDIRSIEITNTSGKIVHTTSNTAINISGYPNGIYLVKINTRDKTVIKRIIKE